VKAEEEEEEEAEAGEAEEAEEAEVVAELVVDPLPVAQQS